MICLTMIIIRMMEKPTFCRLFFFVFTKPDKYGIILMYELLR